MANECKVVPYTETGPEGKTGQVGGQDGDGQQDVGKGRRGLHKQVVESVAKVDLTDFGVRFNRKVLVARVLGVLLVIAILILYAYYLILQVQTAQDNPYTSNSWTTLDSSSGNYSIPIPDVYICIPSPMNAADDPPAMFIQGVYIVEMLDEGVTGCYNRNDEGCYTALNSSLEMPSGFIGGTNFAKTAFVASLGDSVRYYSTASSTSVLHIMLLVVSKVVNPFQDEWTIPPTGALLQLRDPRSFPRPSSAAEAFDLACDVSGGSNSSFTLKTGTYIGYYHERQNFALNADFAVDAPESTELLIDDLNLLEQRSFTGTQLHDFVKGRPLYKEWRDNLTSDENETLVNSIQQGSGHLLEFYLQYGSQLQVERSGLMEAMTWETALGTFAGMASTAVSMVIGAIFFLFMGLRKWEVMQTGITYDKHHLDR